MNKEFRLLMSPDNPNWVDVIYPDGPRYMIHVSNWTCTCMGNTLPRNGEMVECKHLKELSATMKVNL